MQIRLTVLAPHAGHGAGRACDVLVTAPAGTALSAVASPLAAAVTGPEASASGTTVLYAGAERLDGRRCVLGEPPLVDGAVLSLQVPGPDDRAGEAAAARLHVVAGPDAGGVHLLHGGAIRIGRSVDADVPLDDPDVSRAHCTVTVGADGRVTVADRGSTNGTTLDGAPVGERPVRLRPGALLRLGESALRLTGPGDGLPGGTDAVATAPDGEGHLRLTRGTGGPGRPGPAGGPGTAPGGPGTAPRGPAADDTTHGGGHAHAWGGDAADGDPYGSGRGGSYDSGHGDGHGDPYGGARGSTRDHHDSGGRARDGHGHGNGDGDGDGDEGYGRDGDSRDPYGHDGAGSGGAPAARAATAPRAGGRRGLGAWARRLAGGREELPAPAAGAGPVPGTHAGARQDPGSRDGARGPVPGADTWPDPATVLLTALGPGPRLWERDPDHPEFLAVRLGTTDRAELSGVPVTVGLRETGSLGLAGPGDRLAGFARSVVAQLAALHSPSDLEIVLVSADRNRPLEERRRAWGWLGWLPHVRPAHGQDCRLLLAYDRDQAHARTSELTRRLDDGPLGPGWPSADRASVAEAAARHEGPRTVVVVDGDPGTAALRETVARLAGAGAAAGIHLLCLADAPSASPVSPVAATYEAACAASLAFRECGAAALLSGDVATALRLLRTAGGRVAGHGTVGVVDAVSVAWAERFGRALAPLRPETPAAPHGRAAALPPSSRLLDELGLARATPASLMARWASAGDGTAVLGAGPHGPLAVDLTQEGPHLLIEGPAGSGRTELLRSIAASLAAGGRPDRLGLLLVDGAGGERGEGLAACTELPHVIEHLVASDPVRMREFAQALGAELKRRAELLGDTPFADRRGARAPQVAERLIGQRTPSAAESVPRGARATVRLPDTGDHPSGRTLRTGDGTIGALPNSRSTRTPYSSPEDTSGRGGHPGANDLDGRGSGRSPYPGADDVPDRPSGRSPYPGGNDLDGRASGRTLRTNGGDLGDRASGRVSRTGTDDLGDRASGRSPYPGADDVTGRVPRPGAGDLDGRASGRTLRTGDGDRPSGRVSRPGSGADAFLGDTPSGRLPRRDGGAGPEDRVGSRTLRTGEGDLHGRASGRVPRTGADDLNGRPSSRTLRTGEDGPDGRASGRVPRAGTGDLTDRPSGRVPRTGADDLDGRASGRSPYPGADDLHGRASGRVPRAGTGDLTDRPSGRVPRAEDSGVRIPRPASGEAAAGSGRAAGAGALPRLVVLVDDFDALVAPALGAPGRPAAGSVVRALEAVARHGERLGVHLVVASARPDRTADTEPAHSARLRIVLDAPPVTAGPDVPAAGRGRLGHPDGRVTPFQAGRVTGRIPRTATLRPTVVPLEWERMGDPPTRRPVRELGNGPTDLALLASALDRAARSVEATPVAPLSSPATSAGNPS
ncbi:FtsK/SpoIIIE domain-containing protein [Streptomyces sp. WAC08241]|uniref:FtsK/SpoIIIE domain-containing protein n=1 Tax=Streptomyces sp. WAC08241 TaxID=2487421 RepID=UPI0021B01BD5|nr:FtsK/SpoIIIE domain-containing protein [Streptomyces sp. WAC08241]